MANKHTAKLPERYYFKKIEFNSHDWDWSESEEDLMEADAQGVLYDEERRMDWQITRVVYSVRDSDNNKTEIAVPYSVCRRLGFPLELRLRVEGFKRLK